MRDVQRAGPVAVELDVDLRRVGLSRRGHAGRARRLRQFAGNRRRQWRSDRRLRTKPPRRSAAGCRRSCSVAGIATTRRAGSMPLRLRLEDASPIAPSTARRPGIEEDVDLADGAVVDVTAEIALIGAGERRFGRKVGRRDRRCARRASTPRRVVSSGVPLGIRQRDEHFAAVDRRE